MGFRLPRNNRSDGRSRYTRSTNRTRKGTTSTPRFSSRRPALINSRSSTRGPAIPVLPVQRSNPLPDASSQRLSQHGEETNSDPSATHDSNQDADDTLDETIMAVICTHKNSIGCAYYVAREEKLFLMEHVSLGDIEIVETLKLQIDPTTVIVPVNADEKLITLLGSSEDQNNEDREGSYTSISAAHNLETVPPSAFKYDPAMQKILNLGLNCHDPNQLTISFPGDILTHTGNAMAQTVEGNGRYAELLRLSGSVSLENHLSVGCAGAILGYITKRRASRFLPNDNNAQLMFRVATIELFSIKNTMFINRDALQSLQIFSSESHPYSHNQGPTRAASGSKEGLSVYGLFHHLARTPQGKVKLRQWFLRPSLSIELLNERLDAIDIFLRPENSAPFEDITKSLKRVVDARKSIFNLKKGISGDLKKPKNLGRRIWYGLREFAHQAARIERSMGEITGIETLAIYDKMKTKVDVPSLVHAGQLIHSMIDFEETEDPSRIVKSGIYSDLDEKRRLYDGIDSLLAQVACEISLDVPEGLPANLNVVYFPQIGFLISMPKDPETGRSLWEGTETDIWQIMFSSDNSVYYKNDKMIQMDSYIGDVWNDICDKEIEILHDLSLKVLEFEKAFLEASEICGELDCLVALAAGAKMYHFTRPHLTKKNVIDIKQGRHPLQELVVPSFVPNDTYLQGGAAEDSQPASAFDFENMSEAVDSGPNVLLLTGPNFSGKSVYLKQVALMAYLAHIGSFVPAEKATIGVTDKILTRIATRESVSACSSAFALDLQQISLALKLATSRSLLIIDEFGKGTGTADGAGLFAGVIKTLLGPDGDRSNGSSNTPKVLAATHFHELFEMNILAASPALALGHMEIQIDESSETAESGNGEQVVYLYNYRNGRSIKSYGTSCAALNGIEPEIVQRAEHLVKLAARGENLVTACSIMAKDEMEELKVAEKIARAFLQGDLKENARRLLDQIFEAAEG